MTFCSLYLSSSLNLSLVRLQSSEINMKFLNFFVLSLTLSNQTLADSPLKNLAKAAKDVVCEVFSAEIGTVNFIALKNSKSSEHQDFKDELLSKTFEASKVVFRQYSTAQFTVTPGQRKRFTIILIESFEEFLEIYKNLSPKIFKLDGYFFIVLTKGTVIKIEEMFKLLWQLYIINVNVMFVSENNEILVQTFFPFNDENCKDSTPVKINEYRGGKFVNDIENFFPEKTKNLNKCPIRIAISNNTKPSIIINHAENGSFKVSGKDATFINSLSERLNFKIDYTFIGDVGFVTENETTTGAMKALHDGVADIAFSRLLLMPQRLTLFDASTAYLSDLLTFVIPPGRELSSFEKLIYPLHIFTWLLILSYFFVGIIVILIIKHQTRQVQNFVFGTGVKTPSFNMFAGFVGGTQKPLPQRNFARFLLMSFLIYSLVIRTLYHASYFKFLKERRQQKGVEMIQEMIDQEFKFYVYEGIAELYEGTEAMKKR